MWKEELEQMKQYFEQQGGKTAKADLSWLPLNLNFTWGKYHAHDELRKTLWVQITNTMSFAFISS